jgi:excisionase family DNA binding protein
MEGEDEPVVDQRSPWNLDVARDFAAAKAVGIGHDESLVGAKVRLAAHVRSEKVTGVTRPRRQHRESGKGARYSPTAIETGTRRIGRNTKPRPTQMVAFMRSSDFRTYAASMMATHDWKATVQTTEKSTSAFKIARTIRVAVRPTSGMARFPRGEGATPPLDTPERVVTGRASPTEPAETAQASLSRLLTVRELADLLRVPVKTIYTWRYKGIGPPAVPVGRYLRFRVEDVAAWLDARVDLARFTARRDARRRWARGKRADTPDQSFYRHSRG